MFNINFKKLLINCFCLILFSGLIIFLNHCSKESTPISPNQGSNNLWIQDLDYLSQELPKRHINLYFKVSSDEFDQKVKQLRENISTMIDYEIIVEMMKIVAMVGDAHTRIDPRPAGKFHYLPLGMYWLAEGLYVISALQEYESLLGKRIISIADLNIEDVHSQLSSIISHENDSWLINQSPNYMICPEILAGLGIIDSIGTVCFTFDGLGDVNIKAVSQIDYNNMIYLFQKLNCPSPFDMQRYKDNYWYHYFDDLNIIYIQYNRCAEMATKSFQSFTTELFNFVDSHEVNKFIIDLSLNGGGNSSIAQPLIDGVKRRSHINQQGHLFVIIGRATFSSAVLNAVQLKNETNALFIGGPTGGKPNSYGEVKSFTLPNSKIIVSYSTKYFSPSFEDTPSLYPDINVETSLSDIVSCKDPIFDAIFNY